MSYDSFQQQMQRQAMAQQYNAQQQIINQQLSMALYQHSIGGVQQSQPTMLAASPSMPIFIPAPPPPPPPPPPIPPPLPFFQVQRPFAPPMITSSLSTPTPIQPQQISAASAIPPPSHIERSTATASIKAAYASADLSARAVIDCAVALDEERIFAVAQSRLDYLKLIIDYNALVDRQHANIQAQQETDEETDDEVDDEDEDAASSTDANGYTNQSAADLLTLATVSTNSRSHDSNSTSSTSNNAASTLANVSSAHIPVRSSGRRQ